MLIAVSNPSKQYTHQTVAALSNNPNYQVYFLTSFWFMPQHIWWHNWLSKILPINNQLKKKSGDIVRPNIIVTHFSGILYSFIGRFFYHGEARSFFEDKIHDKWAAKWVKKHQPNIFIGYEKSCCNSFKAVKKYGGKTLLDLAQVHINFIEQLRGQYPFFQQITGNEKLYGSIKKIKLEEYELADYVTTLSNFAKDTMLANGYPTSKVSVVNLGANTQLFTAKQTYCSTNTESLKLLFVGAVTKRKGIHILCEVMQELVHENITLDIIGPLGDGIDLSALLKHNDLIQYTPYLHHSELAIKMQTADIFVFPSYLDSWAMVVIEAMACGLPVIITKNTGARDAINGAAGFIIDVDDKAALKEKILQLYNDRSLLEIMGKAARIQAEKYTWQQYYQSVNSIVAKLIEA